MTKPWDRTMIHDGSAGEILYTEGSADQRGGNQRSLVGKISTTKRCDLNLAYAMGCVSERND